jgi:hypothetical protein
MLSAAVEKVKRWHLERLAIVYPRQSSPRQVRENIHSTELQYGLAEQAARLGWRSEQILTLDADLGISGRFSDGPGTGGVQGAGRARVPGGGRGDLRP